LDCQKFFWSSG